MKLKELFADEKRWTKGAYARDAEGVGVSVKSFGASCFCLSGAIIKIHGSKEYGPGRQVYEKIQKYIGHSIVSSWNDAPDRTIEDIQKLCNELDI